MNFNELKVWTEKDLVLTSHSYLFKFSLNDFDVLILPLSYCHSLTYKKYADGKKNKLLKVIPELKEFDFDNYAIVLGLDLANLYLQRINSPFTFKKIDTNKLDAEDYCKLIQNWNLPLSVSPDFYFHDFYMHGIGANFIPSSFVSWWSGFKDKITLKEAIIMSTVVEWTTIKSTSPHIEYMFSPEKWGSLSTFIHKGLESYSSDDLEIVFNKYPTKDFILEWNSFKY